MPTNAEICRMEAAEIAGGVRAKELSPLEVVEAVLERMERLEPTLHAFCTPTPDLAREEARRLEREVSSGVDPGPLAGVPVGIKDLHAVKGVRMVLGSHAYKDFVPDEDDVAVERLKGAGAIVLGKTNVPEWPAGSGPPPRRRARSEGVGGLRGGEAVEGPLAADPRRAERVGDRVGGAKGARRQRHGSALGRPSPPWGGSRPWVGVTCPR